MSTALIRLENICKDFKKQEAQDLQVLDDISLEVNRGEIVALLGKSGAGKSTLLRITAGLIRPSSGRVLYLGKQIAGPVPGVAMVFQSFALMPWLTVLQNVELGLEALGIARKQRRQRALKAIDTIGLDGFESAFPRELSGGMRQRVGLARALVVEPDVLVMDEPFSALDVLTAENLRTDLLDLWEDKQTNIKAILFVSHNIEEAVLMADRILLFDSDPGRIQSEMRIDLEHPRQPQDAKFKQAVDDIYGLMTASSGVARTTHKNISLGYRLPDVEVSELIGLVEMIAFNTPEANQLQELADSLHLDIDELFPIIEVVDILRFSLIQKNRMKTTNNGRRLADADILQKKEIFAEHLLRYVPLARFIRHNLDDAHEHRRKVEYFSEVLSEHLTKDEAKRVLTTIIDWGRYAEIFAYDDSSEELSLENPK